MGQIRKAGANVKSVHINQLRAIPDGQEDFFELSDRSKIASCISKYFPRKNGVIFTTRQNKGLSLLIIKKTIIKDEQSINTNGEA